MVKPPTINFVRQERDSPANKQRREKGLRGITYDFLVLIDGEPRAIFSRIFSGTGYDLSDIDHRPILSHDHRYAGNRRRVEASSQAVFATVIERCLIDELIPTIAEMARLRMIAEADKEDRRIDGIASRKREAAERAGPLLLEALQLAKLMWARRVPRCNEKDCLVCAELRKVEGIVDHAIAAAQPAPADATLEEVS